MVSEHIITSKPLDATVRSLMLQWRPRTLQHRSLQRTGAAARGPGFNSTSGNFKSFRFSELKTKIQISINEKYTINILKQNTQEGQ
jgi:hypothetical protein